MKEFYTVEEAADILRVTRKTVYDWMKAGRLAYVQAGLRKRLIPKEALNQFKRDWGVGLVSDDTIGEDTLSLGHAARLEPSMAEA